MQKAKMIPIIISSILLISGLIYTSPILGVNAVEKPEGQPFQEILDAIAYLQSRIDSLVIQPGPQGPPGPERPMGPQGEQSPKGDTGDIGSQGIQGEQGSEGPPTSHMKTNGPWSKNGRLLSGHLLTWKMYLTSVFT